MRVRVGVDCHESHVDNEKDTVQRGGDGEGEGRGEQYGEEEGVVAEAAECWKENPHENGVGLEKDSFLKGSFSKKEMNISGEYI